VTDHGAQASDALVLASGSASAALVRKLGLYLPVYPLKGYSLTAPAGSGMPQISITDAKKKIVYAPLHTGETHRIRVAGMADIVGHKPGVDSERLDQLILEARHAFPHGAAGGYAPGTIEPWAGLRPATPRGTPILGATPVSGLFVNVGQGALGWTLALGSGQVVAAIIAGRPPVIPLDGLTLANPG
jgi:D-amino-acid dehydrogenase